MLKILKFAPLHAALMCCLLLVSACSPVYDWREVRGTDVPFLVVMPAKPASYSRPVDLDGMALTMTMTAAEVEGVIFAVGSTELPDPSRAQFAMSAMKTGLVKNISGVIRTENALPANGGAIPAIQIEAVGTPAGAGQPRLLLARFISRDKRLYQVVVMGPENDVSREAADTFLTSFKAY